MRKSISTNIIKNYNLFSEDFHTSLGQLVYSGTVDKSVLVLYFDEKKRVNKYIINYLIVCTHFTHYHTM